MRSNMIAARGAVQQIKTLRKMLKELDNGYNRAYSLLTVKTILKTHSELSVLNALEQKTRRLAVVGAFAGIISVNSKSIGAINSEWVDMSAAAARDKR